MRAKLVYESLKCLESLQFQRGGDPRQILNIGQRAIIEEWFRDLERQKGEKIDYTIDDELNIVVDQHLFFDSLNIDWLPDNLKIKGDLYLNNTNITELPDNLRVEEWLDLRNTNITKLPDNLIVKRSIWISKDMKKSLVVPKQLRSKIKIRIS